MGGAPNKIKSDIAKNKGKCNLNVFVKTARNLQKIKKTERKLEKNCRQTYGGWQLCIKHIT